jgi:hypothetical protein
MHTCFDGARVDNKKELPSLLANCIVVCIREKSIQQANLSVVYMCNGHPFTKFINLNLRLRRTESWSFVYFLLELQR